ncbi:MAG: hypothetical protein R2874_06620 [Desulfobacterales bacterium]
MMVSSQKQTEIDLYSIRLIVGLIAVSLAVLVDYFAPNDLRSISAAYHEGGWSRDVFVGFLFAVSAFLLSYNGRSALQMVLSKIAAFAALGLLQFPCKCGSYPEIIPHMHGILCHCSVFDPGNFLQCILAERLGQKSSSSQDSRVHLWYLRNYHCRIYFDYRNRHPFKRDYQFTNKPCYILQRKCSAGFFWNCMAQCVPNVSDYRKQ